MLQLYVYTLHMLKDFIIVFVLTSTLLNARAPLRFLVLFKFILSMEARNDATMLDLMVMNVICEMERS